MFSKLNVNHLKYKTGDLSSERSEDYDLPALTAGVENQGLNNYIPRNGATVLKDVISISANGANTGATFYQSEEFTVLQDSYAVDYRYDEELNDNQYLFLTAAISKTIYGNFTWSNKAGWNRVKNEKIALPIKNGDIDFEFMDSFVAELEAQRVAELEAQRVAELEAYLSATGLKDYRLTIEEQGAVDELTAENLEWGIFEVEDIFDVQSYKKKFNANSVTLSETGDPYVVRMSSNNGIKGYINESSEFLNEGNTISFGQDTATMFYQERPYFTGDKIKILKPKYDEFDKKQALFIIAAMSRSFSLFSWGASSFSMSVIKSQQLKLPINESGNIDFTYIGTIVTAIQKLVIKDVVDWTDKKIAATKEVIDNDK